MKLDLRPRCAYCGKIPRSNNEKDNFAKRYPGYCTYGCQERHNLAMAREHLRTMKLHKTTGASDD